MLEAGKKATVFTLTADNGKKISLKDFLGKKVVIYFYPRADTPGCTRQACGLRDVYPKIEDKNVLVIGISPDQPEKLVKFREKYNLPFILLSDPDHKVAEKYGAWGEKKLYGKVSMGIIRSHYAIDEKGKIAEFKYKVKPETTAELALKL